MERNRGWLITALAGLGAGLALAAAQGQIPTLEERILHSSLNPSNNTWQARNLRIWPMPAATNGVIACYRYDFDLPAKPRQATLTFKTGNSRQLNCITVNGAVVAAPMLPKLRGGIRTLDLTPHLRSGHNVFALESEDVQPGHGLHLLAEGMLFGEDGSVLRLMTDKTWRGGWNLPAGWEKPETDPKSLPLAEAMPQRPVRIDNLPFYIGRIQVEPAGMSQPLFDAEMPVELALTLVNAQKERSVFGVQASGKQEEGSEGHRSLDTEHRTPNTEIILAYEIMNEESRQKVTSGKVELKPKGALDLAGTLRHGPLPAGAYRVRLTMTAGTNEVDRRDYEVVSVGVIPQRLVEGTSYEDGMDLNPVWTVDCTQEPEPGMYITGGYGAGDVPTKVVEGPAGKYRELATAQDFKWFAYRFKVKTLYAPHLLVIEWPDDAPRSMLAQVYEPTTMFSEGDGVKNAGWQRGETSFVSIDEQPRLSGKMQKLHIIYWPNEEDASIHLWNACLGTPAKGLQPAAASRISVYEIANDLPALRIAEPATPGATKAECGERMIGYHSERANILPTTCYAGPLGAKFHYGMSGVNHAEFYRNWYTTTENLIKRMRFSGQNMYLLGHFMYDGALYPSKKFMFEQNAYSGGDATRDYAGIILRMFDRNGMSMISGIEYVHTAEILAASSNTLEQVVRDGAPTLFSISRHAKLSTLHSIAGWAGLNYFHPQVQGLFLTMAEELTDLYKEYPAWKGISLILSRNFGPMMAFGYGATDEALDWGYEDYTIALFQQETGIKIPPFDSAQGGPATGPDPDRFAKRYDWLMANAKQKWIDWRCEQLTKLFRKMRDILVKGRPDLKLYLLTAEPMNFTKQATDLFGHYDDPAYMSQIVKTFGFDTETLRKEPGMVISYFYSSPGTGAALGQHHRGWWELLHSTTWQDLWANDGKGGAYVWSGIPHYGVDFPKGKWIFEGTGSRQGYLWPRYMSDAFVNVLLRSNPTWIPHTWMDVVDSCGRLQDLRLFARVYRSLPNGKYERLAGNGLDFNIWVESTKKASVEYAYAANPHWWDLDEVTLQFAPGVKVHDLIKDVPVALKDGKWTFNLGPYEAQSFRVEGGKSGQASAVIGATVKIAKGPGMAVIQSVNEATEVVARARAKEAELRDFPGWASVAPLEKLIMQTWGYSVSGDVARAEELATSWTVMWRKSQIVNQALEAMPFLALGPFGDPKDVVLNEKAGIWFDVVPGYRGMETPYIGEFAGTNWDALTEGFAPDPEKSFTVYPGKPVQWQPIVKAEYISFLNICHSDVPFWMVAYAYTEIFSPQERDALLLGGSDHAMWVWLNGKRTLKYGGADTLRGGQHGSAPDQYQTPIRLAKGWNQVLVKVVQRGETRIFFRLTDTDGKPMDDLKFRVPKVA